MKVKPIVDYDYVFIGTSPIAVLEALYQSLGGKKVLMIEQQNEMGGAWLPLKIFGYQNVENAIHYFLPDQKGFKFMKDILRWRVVTSRSKYRIFEKPIFGQRMISYDHPFGDYLVSLSQPLSLKKRAEVLVSALLKLMRGERKRSTYVEGGAAEMLEKISERLKDTTIEFKYLTYVEDIFIDTAHNRVELQLAHDGQSGVVSCRTVYMTHGSKIKSIREACGPIVLGEEKHLRPAVHFLIQDAHSAGVLEAIFHENKLIKYVHDITRYAKTQEVDPSKKILVFALHPHVTNSSELCTELMGILKSSGVVSSQAVLLDYKWWDIYLPALSDRTLEGLKNKFENQIEILKTENFARGIGRYADRWRTRFH